MIPHSRETQRQLWARTALSDPNAVLERASADASFRSYWRTHSSGQSWIVMDAPPEKEDIQPWLNIAERLNAVGLRAPAVQASEPQLGFVLMADLGTRLYLPELDNDSADALYDDALTALLTMQTQVSVDGLPHYDEPRLVSEMELMPEWFLRRHLGYTPECEEWDIIENAFRALVNNAQAQPQVFVHRDYHSRNLLIDETAGPGILDFQDAVRGPVTYDLVSLLRDCYIAWPEERVYAWIESYRRKLAKVGLASADTVTFQRHFDLMGLQRHIKVLGIFCRLWYRDGKSGYLNDLPLVWDYTRTIGLRYPEIAPLIHLIERVLDKRVITEPKTLCVR